MEDAHKSREQLLAELAELRAEVYRLKSPDTPQLVEVRQALHYAQAQLKAVLHNAPVAVFVLDPAGTVTLIEGKTTELLARLPVQPTGDWLHASVFELFKDYPVVLEICQRLLAGETITETVKLSAAFVEVAALPLHDEAGQLAGVTGVVVDVTARKKAEEDLRRSEERLHLSQRLESVGRLTGGIAHDFNNLLSAIMGYAGLVSTALDLDSPIRKDVEEIERTSQRAASLTRQLLAFGRRHNFQAEVLDLNEVVRDMTSLLRRLLGVNNELRLHLLPELGRVKLDRTQLEQIILNLVVNAHDAIKGHGFVTIESSNVDLDEPYVSQHIAVKPGQYILLTVSDNGRGMDAVTQSRIFEPFFTTKQAGEGTGLGLYTVYGIVKQSSGNVWVYSEVGVGTTFKVYLPRVHEALSLPQPQPVSRDFARGTETILLVEDEEAVRKLTRRVLERSGYKVLEAQHGLEALHFSQPGAQQIDLLLTDVVMPHFNGQELARQLCQDYPGLRVLYMSGYTYEAIVTNDVLEANTGFIQKPFTPGQLLEAVRQVLDQPAQILLDAEPTSDYTAELNLDLDPDLDLDLDLDPSSQA